MTVTLSAAAEERQTLCRELPLIEDRLRRARLFRTAAALNKALQIIGFEAAVLFEEERAD